MIGLAVIPATDVLPTCSMLQYLPDKTESKRWRNALNHEGQVGSYCFTNVTDMIQLTCVVSNVPAVREPEKWVAVGQAGLDASDIPCSRKTFQ